MKKTGEVIWINLTASVIHGPDGEPLHGLAMVEDITEIKRTQEEALFRQKLESVGTLAGGIAHDFNNLLGAVQAQAELALAELDEGSSCKEQLNAIREVAMRGSEIVRQLMIYAGKESTVVELVDLSTIVEEMLSLLKVSVTKRAVIKADLDRHLPASPRQCGTTSANCDEPHHKRLRCHWRSRWNHSGDHKACDPERGIGGDGIDHVAGGRLRGTGSLRHRSRHVRPKRRPRRSIRSSPPNPRAEDLGSRSCRGSCGVSAERSFLRANRTKAAHFRYCCPVWKAQPAIGQATSVAGDLAVPSQHGTVLVVEDEDHLRASCRKDAS